MQRLWFIAAILSVLVLLSGCKDEQEQKETESKLPPKTVSVAEVQLISVTNQIEVIGTVESIYRAEISAKISGTITNLPVFLGAEVTKGDVLLEISAGEIDAKVRQSHAKLNQAKRNLERERKLLTKNAATSETVKSLEESLVMADAAYEEARIIQGYTRVLAPFDGRITHKMANAGDLATPGKPLLNIEDESQLQVITNIPEVMILQVKQGDKLSVFVPSAGLSISGTVAEVAPIANPTTRSGLIKLTIEAHPNLRPGQFARVTLSLQSEKTLTVPRQALLPLGQLQRLFVIDNGEAHLRLVRSGADHGDFIEILSGVRAGDQVVIEGHQSLHDRQPVVIQ